MDIQMENLIAQTTGSFIGDLSKIKTPHSKTWLKREACDLMASLLNACIEDDSVYTAPGREQLTHEEVVFMEQYIRKEIQKLYNRGQPLTKEPEPDFPLSLEYGTSHNDDGLY